MEHIPRVRDSKLAISQLTVPYLAREWEYGSSLQGIDSFAAFPAKHGYKTLLDDDERKDGDGGQYPTIGFLQAWLYFGLLAEAFGTPEMCFDYRDFIHESPSGFEVTSKELMRYVWYWTAGIVHGHRDDYDAHCENLDKCVEVVNQVVNAFCREYYSRPEMETGKDGCGGSELSATTAVLFSIISLTDYIRRARIDTNAYSFESSFPELKWEFPPQYDALKSAGWCEGEITGKLERTTDCSIRFYLSQIDRWSMGNDHSKCSSKGGCMAHQIDESTYKTRHRPDCKSAMCWSLGPDAAEIVRILDDGSYPLVQLSRDEKSVEIKPAKEGDVYVTISHVWSDGLGNPHNNTLPHCQLVYIQGLVNALYPESEHPIPFWNDTLCIPVDPNHLPFRRLAIGRMHKTFRSSSKTLALDNSLMAQSTDNDDWVEMNMRIKYSPWVSRAWTLLEGRVGKELLFQFKDKAVSSSVLFNRSNSARNVRNVCRILGSRDVNTVLAEPNAVRLARALTLLPQEPRQDEEEDDPEILPAARKAYSTWLPILQNANLASDMTDLDKDMSVVVDALRIVCPVTKHASVGAREIRDEFWLESLGESSTSPQYPTHAYFEGVVTAFRGRTTSKIEDETLCFGQMLGMDTSHVTSIKPLTARERYWYTLFNSYPILNTLAHAVGIDPGAKLAECREKRVQTLLLQIGKLPLSVILWDTPRMHAQGWKWAPSSLLGAAPTTAASMGWASNERGIVSPEGFTLSLPGLRVQSPSGSGSELDIPLSDVVYLVVSTNDEFMGPGTARFRISLHGDLPWHRIRTWGDLIQAGIFDQLIIVTRRRASSYDLWQKHAVLLQMREAREEGAQLVDFRAVIDRPHEYEIETESLPTISVSGVWDTESSWCIA